MNNTTASTLPVVRLPKPCWQWTNGLRRLFFSCVMKIAMRFQGRFGFRAVALGLYDYPYIQALPFGLLIKTTPRPEQEALATMTAHAMGVPTPRILSYAEVDSPDDPGHILMTAIPGDRLWDAYQGYSAKQLATIATELGGCFRKLGSFTSPYGNAVCGPDGKRVHTRVAPMYDLSMDRFESPRLYHETLISWGEVSDHKPDYSTLLEEAGKLLTKEYRVVFAHGDLHLTNILVKDGHLAGIIDWADAGWYPEYWDFVNPMLFWHRSDNWAVEFMRRVPGAEHYNDDRKWFLAALRLAGPVFG